MSAKEDNLKDNTIKALGWSGFLQSFSQALSFVIGIFIARLLTPDDFGLVAMVMVFVAFSQLFSDLGFSAALIQRKGVRAIHYISCFWFNSFIGLCLTLIMFTASGAVANFYERQELIGISQSLSVLFLLTSASSVPKAKLLKNLRHKDIGVVEIISNLAAGLFAVALAIYNYSFWSLVGQLLALNIIRLLLLFKISKLSLSLHFSFKELRTLLSFSSTVFGTKVIREGASQIDKLLVGKFIDSSTLGLYSRAYSLMLFPIQNISRVVANVMFPAFSKIQDQPDRVGAIFLKTIGCISFLTFPILLGFATVAPHFIKVVFGEQWLGMTFFLQFFCILGLLLSVVTVTGSIYLGLGRPDLQLKVNLITQPLKIVCLSVGVMFGIDGLLVGYFVSFMVSVFITWSVAMTLVRMNISHILKSIFPALGLSILMAGVTWAVNETFFHYYSEILRLTLSVVLGALLYVVLNLLFKPAPYMNILAIIKPKIISRFR